MSEIISHPRQVRFTSEFVQPPGECYVNQEDILDIESWNANASVALTVYARLLDPSGQIQTLQWPHIPLSNRTRLEERFRLDEGFLISAFVVGTGTDWQHGETFVHLSLGRGGPITGIGTELLVADYVSATDVAVWPAGRALSSVDGGGAIVDYLGPAPGVGNEISQSLPTNARWKIWSVSFLLTTSAVVANRRVIVNIGSGGGTVYRAEASGVQAASTTRWYTVGAQGVLYAPGQDSYLIPFPAAVLAASGASFFTTTANLQGGDFFWPQRYHVEEWLQDM